MLDRPDLTDEEYAKYRYLAFPRLSKRAEMLGMDQMAVLIGGVCGFALFMYVERLLLAVLVAAGMMVTLDFYWRKDPQWFRISRRIRGLKLVHSSWYRHSQLRKGGRRVERIVFTP